MFARVVPYTISLRSWRLWLLEGASAAVVCISAPTFLGYIIGDYHLSDSWFMPGHNGMSFQTSVCLMLLGMAQLLRGRITRDASQSNLWKMQ